MVKPVTRSRTILRSKSEIMEYTGFSEYLLRKWIARGLPVLIDDAGNWTAHADNIEDFFRVITRKRSHLKDVQGLAEEGGSGPGRQL